jgi:mannose-6-phosphate isomerase-like protein (cupin superfamily)
MRAGDAIWNPLSGEKALLIESAEESDGARIVVDFAVEEGGFVPGGEHIHDNLSEHFEVLDGTITFVVDGVKRALDAGEKVTVPPGSWHRWWNSGRGEVHVRVQVDPALRFQEAIQVMWGLCADGHTSSNGTPSPLYGALLATRYEDEVRLRKPSETVQKILLPPLAMVARWLGKDDEIEKYLDLGTHPSAAIGLGHLPEQIMRSAR